MAEVNAGNAGNAVELTACRIDLVTGALSGGRDGRLTERERLLVAYLAARPGRTVPRDELLGEVWGYSDHVVSRAVDSTVRRVREKIEVDPAQPRHLLTAFGAGYRFEPLRDAAPVHAPPRSRRCLVLGARTVDLDLGELHVPGAPGPIALTTGEVAVLAALAERGGQTVEPRELARAAGTGGVRALHNAVYRLRAKLEPDPEAPQFLLTVRKGGYRLQVPLGAPRRRAVTLVQVGIADERALWGSAPERAASATERLVAWLVQAAGAGGGVPVGDWRFTFDEPEPGLAFAVRAAGEAAPVPELTLRAAVHRGHPVVWVDPITGRASCLGPEVHRVDDLLRRAPPGAVLVDEALWAELGEASGLPGRRAAQGAVVVGERAGVPQPGFGGPAALPWVGDRFVGREADLHAFAAALAGGARLVTLAGPPGVGKSRLALEALARHEVPGGVFHVPLGAARSPEEVVAAVAGALAMQAPTADGADPLTYALAHGPPTALWLDDVDLAGPAAAPLVAKWLAAAPGLVVVATARRALALPGEVVLPVAPLPEPEACVLFVDRAGAAGLDEAAVLPLVRALDGLPLALELAAARTAALPLDELVRRITRSDARLKLLARTDGAGRHRSVRAALDVSWELLARHEREALARSAVFRGGFGLDLAEAVLDAPGAPWIVDLVEALVRHHLVRVEGGRYVLLDSVQAYAAERLAASPEAAAQAERAHGAALAELGRRAALDRLAGPDGLQARRQLFAEGANLEAAFDRAVARSDAAQAADLALALFERDARRGPFAAGVARLDRALALPAAPRRAELLVARGWLAALSGDPVGGERALEQAIAAATEAGEPVVAALGEARLGFALTKRASAAARGARFSRALALVRGQPTRAAAYVEALATMGHAATLDGAARVEAEERALALARRLGDEELEGQVLAALGMTERMAGRNARARERLEAALVLHRRHGDRRYEAMSLGNLGNSLRYEDPEGYVAAHRQAIEVHRQNGSLHGVAASLGNIAALRFDRGDLEAARQACAEAVDLLAAIGATDTESLFRSNLGTMLHHLGRSREAIVQFERGLALAEALGDEERIATAVLGLTVVPAPPTPRTVALLERAVRGFVNQPEHQLHTVARLGQAKRTLGDVDGARAALLRAEALEAELPANYPADGPARAELAALRRSLSPVY